MPLFETISSLTTHSSPRLWGVNTESIASNYVSVNSEISLATVRSNYTKDVASLAKISETMQKDGVSKYETAKTLHRARRSIAEKYRSLTPEPIVREIRARNMCRYGDATGPSFEYLINKAREKGLAGDAIYDSIIKYFRFDYVTLKETSAYKTLK